MLKFIHLCGFFYILNMVQKFLSDIYSFVLLGSTGLDF